MWDLALFSEPNVSVVRFGKLEIENGPASLTAVTASVDTFVVEGFVGASESVNCSTRGNFLKADEAGTVPVAVGEASVGCAN